MGESVFYRFLWIGLVIFTEIAVIEMELGCEVASEVPIDFNCLNSKHPSEKGANLDGLMRSGYLHKEFAKLGAT